ncbi:hypothetical protein FQN60_007483 [Etheostoma spectabile]|uniref:CCHC-type domain-containing protein n=1 Tax=Etheostoma spectabile TaxID=54343 RepID=A0A5J5CXQ2_9PERO|nr:hypothetical protein FQN60_007483 [Etheostoma spectabile]
MSDSDGQGQEPAGLEGLPPMHSISKGEVVSLQTYGAFVRLPGYKKEVTQFEFYDILIRGDKVKLSFSMKAVNQGTGQDLDPNNVMAEQDARRRKQFRDHTGNRITLEAVLNTTCSKCGCKGHFTKDCFSAPGLQYALLPEEDEEEQQQQQQTSTVSVQQDSDKKKKKKKEKKMKKKRKRDRKESESDSSSSSGECKSKRRRHEHTHDKEDKKKKKHKKHRSHKHS